MKGQKTVNLCWDELYAKIFAAALSVTRDKNTAEEIAQETCIKIHQNQQSFRGESQFFTWAYAMMLNTYRDYCRQAKRHWNNSLGKLKELGSSFDFSEYVAACSLLDKLPRLQKKIFILREYYGLSYQEIARITRCSMDSVRTRLYRARKQLSNWTALDT